MSEKTPVVVLAAGHISTSLARATGAAAKGMIEVGGRPIIDRLLEGLEGAKLAGEVCVVCAENSPLIEHVGERAVECKGETIVDSLRCGLEALGRPERILIVTGDLPLLSAESVDHFLGQVLHSDASIVYSVVAKRDCERVLPGGRRTYFRLLDGVFTGGNIAVMRREFLDEQGQQLERAFSMRKNPLALSALLGWGFVFRFVAGRLSLAQILARAGAILGADVDAVISPYPEVGFDVDKPGHIATVEALIARSMP
ncbi:MAG: nucleotidyltransferase family protein [Armatimonadetes bacterium]|jgi:GTP:adenosylcobinamide-phosphate guanylyltransferase|nr:nucleotidyltransferase family protein [Armatimonadota bacterium]MDI9585300.1 nucleotidyltransferase family protein [Acidobacteriota bacterium]